MQPDEGAVKLAIRALLEVIQGHNLEVAIMERGKPLKASCTKSKLLLHVQPWGQTIGAALVLCRPCAAHNQLLLLGRGSFQVLLLFQMLETREIEKYVEEIEKEKEDEAEKKKQKK